MKSSLALIFLGLVAISCKPENSPEVIDEHFFPCTEFKELYTDTFSWDISSRGLVPFSDGHLFVMDHSRSEYMLFDDDFNFVKSYDVSLGSTATGLQDNSVLMASSDQLSRESIDPLKVSAYHQVSVDSDCKPVYKYQNGTSWKGWKSDAFTDLTKISRSGDIEFRLTLEGNIIGGTSLVDRLQIVEREGFIYIATFDADSAKMELVMDQNGIFKDTVVINSRNKVNLYKLDYSGMVVWKKSVNDVIGLEPGMGKYFGATKNCLWVFSAHEIFQFDFNGNLMRSNCNGKEFEPGYFVDSGIYGKESVEGGQHVVLTESFDFKEKPHDVPTSCFATDGNMVFFERYNEILSYDVETKQKKVLVVNDSNGWVKPLSIGCDGSIYFTYYTSFNSPRYLVRMPNSLSPEIEHGLLISRF